MHQSVLPGQPPEMSQEPYRGKGALDAFLNLLSLVTLGWTAFSFGGVLFQIINKFFGSPTFGYREGYYSGFLKFNIASLLIVTPIFFILTAILHRHYKEKKLNSESGIHRWLTYLMLFIAFCNIVGSLVALVFKFLDGIFLSSFILKALTILIIALGVFGYYWYDLRRKDYSSRSAVSQASSAATIIFGVIVLVTGFIIVGSPQKSRMVNYDNKRVEDLNSLRRQIESHYRSYKALPENLEAAQFQKFKDPETKKSYEYQVVGSDEYRLCAEFSLAIDPGETGEQFYAGAEEWYYHKAGKQCYTLKIEEEKSGKPYPVTLPPKLSD